MKEKSNFIPNLCHPLFVLCHGFCKGLVVGCHFGFLLFGRPIGGLLKFWCVFLLVTIWSIENLVV